MFPFEFSENLNSKQKCHILGHDDNMHISVQLYTLRDLLDKDLSGTLKKLGQIGYKSVEMAGLHGQCAEGFAQELKHAGLRAMSCHVGLNDVTKDLEKTVAMAKTLGCHWIVVPWVGKEEYELGWDKFGQKLGEIAKGLLSHGLKFAYHNHSFEFDNQNGEIGYGKLWEGAPETVEAEMDLWWVHHAGQDPSDWLRKLAGRVPLTHFKDGIKDKHMPVGEGEMDWKTILASAKMAGVEWAIVELDECPRDPIDCVQSSFEFLRKMGLKP